ncbi:metalloprotease TIKI1-like [Asterias rubens]|uniref:metalloprotease TIKI1-like n=1 Tax=Asterias rubens TaxID=7604 RepID=UPI00145520C4|nr:metalloprotease TIKI1-like [Asterias rubens]
MPGVNHRKMPCFGHLVVVLIPAVSLLLLPWPISASVERLREKLLCENSSNTTGGVNSFLWRVKRDTPAYFFGTIHVPYTRVWDYIPDNIKQAFGESENIFFELDLTDTYTISTLTNCQLLPHGENLSDVLPRSLFERLRDHLEYVKVMMPSWMTADQRGRGLYADYLFNAIAGNWERKRPIWVMLMVNALTETDIKSRGIPVLDLFLAQEAMRMNKRTGAVERVEEQCMPLNGLNFTQVLFALNQTLWQQEVMRSGLTRRSYTTEDLIWHYNCGNLNSVIINQDTAQVPNILNSTLGPYEISLAQEIDEYFREELIYKRNRRMASRVKEILDLYPDKSFFFAFGAGHFLGNNTVLDRLRDDGFEIENVPAYEEIRLKHSEMTPDDLNWLLDATETTSRGKKQRLRRRRKKKKNLQQEFPPNEQPQKDSSVETPEDKDSKPERKFIDLWVPLTGKPLPKITEDPKGVTTISPYRDTGSGYNFLRGSSCLSAISSSLYVTLALLLNFLVTRLCVTLSPVR